MRRAIIYFLRTVTVVIGLCALALLLWEPHIEGRNAHATLFQIYFNDPFLAYAYLASIPFFVAVYQAFKFLGYSENNALSQASVRALRIMKFCALAIVGFVAVGELVFILFNNSDDRAGGVVIGGLIALGSLVVAAAAAMFEWIFREAIEP